MIVNKKESNTFNQNILNQIGNTDISGIGDGTLTGAISMNANEIIELNNVLAVKQDIISTPYGDIDVLQTGHIITLDMKLSGLTMNTHNSFNIPEKYSPINSINDWGIDGNTGLCLLYIEHSGLCKLKPLTGTYCYAHIEYIIE